MAARWEGEGLWRLRRENSLRRNASNKKQFMQGDKGATTRCVTDNDDNPIPFPEYEKNKKNNNDEGNNSGLNGKILKKSTNVKRHSDYDIAKNLMQVMRHFHNYIA